MKLINLRWHSWSQDGKLKFQAGMLCGKLYCDGKMIDDKVQAPKYDVNLCTPRRKIYIVYNLEIYPVRRLAIRCVFKQNINLQYLELHSQFESERHLVTLEEYGQPRMPLQQTVQQTRNSSYLKFAVAISDN